MKSLEVTREQSRLIFNGPVGCYKQLAGLFRCRNYTLWSSFCRECNSLIHEFMN